MLAIINPAAVLLHICLSFKFLLKISNQGSVESVINWKAHPTHLSLHSVVFGDLILVFGSGNTEKVGQELPHIVANFQCLAPGGRRIVPHPRPPGQFLLQGSNIGNKAASFKWKFRHSVKLLTGSTGTG